MKNMIVTYATTLACVFLGAFSNADTSQDRAQIANEVEKYVAAFNARDAKALANLWTEGGIYSNPRNGEEVTGRAAIEKQFTQLFGAVKGARLDAKSQSIQFVSPSVAIEQGFATVTVPNEPSESSEYSAVYVKVADKWLLDRITENDIVEVPSNYEHLKELEWMVGRWADESENDRIEMTCQWTKNRNYLVRNFSVVSGDSINFAGMQVIGWDPNRKQIRSWVFDSDGGFGEGFWKKKAQTWSVQTTGILQDGAKATGVGVMTLVDENSFKFKTVDRQVGDEMLPNVPETLVVRQPNAE